MKTAISFVLYTIRIAGIIAIKLILLGIIAAAQFLLNRLDNNEATSNKALNKASDEIWFQITVVWQAIKDNAPQIMESGVSIAKIKLQRVYDVVSAEVGEKFQNLRNTVNLLF